MGGWLLVILILLMLVGMPISFAMGVTALIGFVLLDKLDFLSVIPQTMFAGLNSFPILAMPFFILAGEIMNRTQITNRLMRLGDVLVGWIRGGLGHAYVVASVIVSGISGSAVADASALGPLLIPAMTQAGYKKTYAAALVAASAVIGPVIPPSIIMVIYGALMNVSIAGMFAAGIIPGLLIGGGLMAVNYAIAKRRNYPKSEMPGFRDVAGSIVASTPALIMPLIILGGILGGVFTPTEAAAVAVAYALFVGFGFYRTLTLRDVYESVVASFRTCGVVMVILAAGSVLAWLFAIDHVPEQLAAFFTTLGGNNRYLILLIVNVFLILVGMFMDMTAALIILAPVLAPVAVKVGVDPLHFGVMMCINLSIGLITPPVGACLFVAASISKLKYEEVIREVWPFIIVEVVVLLMLIYIPELTMVVPRLLGLAAP
jgi:tripartite ATP-independent transporter DctM subunit